MQCPKLLIRDSDVHFSGALADFLLKRGYDVAVTAGNGLRDWLVSGTRPDLCIIEDKLIAEALPMLRGPSSYQNPAFIVLDTDASYERCIQALEAGADDYMAKPCSPRELLARVRAVQRSRRPTEVPASISCYRFSGWTLHLAGSVLVSPTEQIVVLSDGQFCLLKAFLENPGQLMTRDQLVCLVGGAESEVFDRSIDSQICRLRRKLDGSKSRRPLIRTVRGEGYMLSVGVAAK